MAEGAVRAVVIVVIVIVSVRAHFPAGPEVRPGTGFGREIIIRFLVTVDGLLELLGKHRETVQPDLVRNDFLVPLPEGKLRLVERLAGDVVRHVGGEAGRLAADRQRQGMLAIVDDAVLFPVHGFQRVGAVAEGRERHPHGVMDIETAGGIREVPGLDRLVSFPEGKRGLIQIAERDAHILVFHPNAYALAGQGFGQVLDGGATSDDLGVVPFQGLAFLFVGQAIGIQGLVGGRSGFLLVQFAEPDPEQFLAGPEGDRLAGVLLRHFLQGGLPVGAGLAVRHIEGQIAFAGLFPRHLSLQGPVEFILFRIVIAAGTEQVP